MTLVVDHSGRSHTKRKCTMKDLIANSEAWSKNMLAFQQSMRDYFSPMPSLTVLVAGYPGWGGGPMWESSFECLHHAEGNTPVLQPMQTLSIRCGK